MSLQPLTEAECLLSSRPLTLVWSENQDDDPLRPNHFLLGRSDNTSLSKVSQFVADIMDQSQAALSTNLETNASRSRPNIEPETKVDVKRSCSGGGRCSLAAGGVDSPGNLATRTCHRNFHRTRQNRKVLRIKNSFKFFNQTSR